MSNLAEFKILIEKIFHTQTPPLKLINNQEVFNFDNVLEKIGVMCLVFYKNGLLLVERSSKVDSPNIWHPVSGYYDQFIEPIEIAKIELKEEISINIKPSDTITVLKIFTAPFSKITWHMFPVMIELDEMPTILLNEENINARFINIEELENLEMIPRVKEFVTLQFKNYLDETLENNSIK
jgi:8-oxo-dGTP pyrophosphatase MutT (NUDIX family)